MAINRETSVLSVLVIFLMIISRDHTSMCVQGRHLRPPAVSDPSTKVSSELLGGTTAAGGVGRKMDYNVDDFRPTTPGHSPGVGHSINN
ncbi:unnamed protein product [Linum tenue]|uniref:Encoded peptide n=2 Tax=Linum tenue TaxID=586396 RepID=A0AAV0R9X2_9ROSI|nr:unnamed protein product [Linum tenue]